MAAPTASPLLSETMLQRFRARAPVYDRENRFFQEDFDELREAGYLAIAAPREVGGRGLTFAECMREQRRLGYYAHATALAMNMHLYWVGVAADLWRAGDRSLEWVLDLRVMNQQTARNGDRGLGLEVLHREVEGVPAEPIVDVGEAGQRPGEDGQDEQVGAGEAGGDHACDVPVGHESPLEHGVLAGGGAHPQDVPGLLDRVPLGRPGHERMHDLRCRRIARVHSVQAQVGPDGCQAPEGLVAGEPVPSRDPLGLRGREEEGHVVAALRMPDREDLAADGPAEAARGR
jgi:acyl-CoA dehydrogenase-like protein